jgi:hypothetical protein
MKKIVFVLSVLIALVNNTKAQTINPYEAFGYKPKNTYVITKKPEGMEIANNDTTTSIKSIVVSPQYGKVFVYDRSGFKAVDVNGNDKFRFLSVDPLTAKYPELTPSQFSSNRPIDGVDQDGLEYYYAGDGKFLGQGRDPMNTEVRLGKITGQTNSSQKIITAVDINGNSQKQWSVIHKNHNEFIAFASLINQESSGGRKESFAIGNLTMNFLRGGGSAELKTLNDIAMYKNAFARGASQNAIDVFTKVGYDRNSKYAIGAAINALGHFNNPESSSYVDYSNGANRWDGLDLIQKNLSNIHRSYSWSTDSKSLLQEYDKISLKAGNVDITNWTFKKKNFQISATTIIGNTLFENLNTGSGEKKQSDIPFNVTIDHK